MKQALIVGSLGQDGRLLSQFLVGQGYAVTGLSRLAVHFPNGYEAPPVDLADPSAVAEIVRQVHPDEIYYLAAFHHSSQQAEALALQTIWSSSMAINAAGPVNFLEALCLHAPQARFFYAGSCLAYGDITETPQTELTCLRPSCVYGISKAAGTHAVRLYRKTYGVFAVTGILYNHESHLRPEKFLSRKIVRTAVRIKWGLERELVLGNLDARADWGYAPDFVQAFWKTLRAETPDDYVIATGKLHGVYDWLERSFALAGLDWRNYVREDPDIAARERPPLVGDISYICKQCDWTPSTEFDRMVELMFDYEDKS